MSSISEYRKGKNVPRSLFREDILEDFINYGETIKMHPWIVSEDCDCIISPDCDGFLCGLLVSNLLNWNIAGFYDGKALVFENKIDFNDCVFLDCEINRIGVKSIGNHLLEYNRGVALETVILKTVLTQTFSGVLMGKILSRENTLLEQSTYYLPCCNTVKSYVPEHLNRSQ